MKKQTKLVLALLLAQACINVTAADNVKVSKMPVEAMFKDKISTIMENKKFSFGKKPIDKLTVKEKEAILTAVLENLCDQDHKDNFALHAELIAFLFNQNNTTKDYKDLALFLKKNKDCKSIFVFLGSILPEVRKKASKEITDKVSHIIEEKGGTIKVGKVINSKLSA